MEQDYLRQKPMEAKQWKLTGQPFGYRRRRVTLKVALRQFVGEEHSGEV